MKNQAPSQKPETSYAGRVLLPILLAVSSSFACALDTISDDDLGNVTGEGIAFLPENMQMALQTPGTGTWPGSITADIANRANDTGYIRIVPVGPLSDTTLGNATYGATAGKADMFLYGLALSRGDGNANNRLSAGAIRSWGTATNPWLLKVQTQASVPNFDTASGTGSVSYLALEAPFYNITIPTDATSGPSGGADAYNLKLAYWTDIFNRKWDVAENMAATGTQFDVGGASRQNRLRLQAVWDGFSLNGSNFRMFQTLGGATNTGGMSTFYNNTLGLSALIRMNSGDSRNLKATETDTTTSTTGTVSGWNNVHGGWSTTLGTAQTGGNCGNGGATNTAYSNTGSAGCQYMVQNRSRTDSKTRTRTWTPPTAGVLRLSTRETTGSTVDLTTPAINGGSAPTFAANEGLYLYAPNINLPLGSLAQPLVTGVAPDGRNLVLEIARIPNKAAAYNAIYTNYGSDPGAAAFTGSTCNVHQCGTALSGALSGYQASSATHGSISIGTTNYDSATNRLTAYSGSDAVGVSFGALTAQTSTNNTSVALTEVQYRHRAISNTPWTQAYSCTVWVCGVDTTGNLSQWIYYDSPTTTVNWNYTAPPSNASCSGFNCSSTSGSTPMYGSAANRAWTYATSGGAWLTASNTTVDAFIGAGNGVTGGPNLATALNQAPNPVVNNPVPTNNLGSVVIDGILIQHLKFTTKGM